MIKMEILFNEKKLKEQNIEKELAINIVENIAKEAGITKKDANDFFIGNDNNQDFANFGKIILKLNKENWFLTTIEKWIWYVGDEEDDLATHYKQKAHIA